MTIELLPQDLAKIRNYAESTYPEEGCGILIGHLTSDRKTVVEVRPTENAWSAETADFYRDGETGIAKSHRYAIAPIELLKAQREARDRHLAIVGIFHSHPDRPAIPSECDRVCAWPEYSYIIVSVQQGIASDTLSWNLDDTHQFVSEKIILSSNNN